ncbi:sorting nexin-13 [Trichonephila inaurata madagascariensis]|uniref:Sorting nexin-13 n=1 Tax=Trichonephila inaurata madagascariensis TaxID=2747483 RepID=A0A8X6YNH3_9ARAC|nr:sorting nexin-13 [Trichonephila inaurata madagascariensis]
MMTSKIFWLLLVMLLSIATFGLWMCVLIIVSCVFTIMGFIFMSNSGKNLRVFVNFDVASKSTGREDIPFFGIPKVVLQMNRSTTAPKFDKRLTGSNEIDFQLREILSYIVRDFIESWYKDVSSNADFINGFNDMCKNLINNFSKSSKEVNWISFFTQRVVEDFTSHLRLFRHTEIAHRKKHRENPDNYITIESIFFEKEKEFEKDLCREIVCSCPDKEKEYLQCICDVLLYILLPPEDFDNRILKHFLREVLTSSVLQPLLSQFSDPDIINQNLIWLCKDHVLTNKILLGILRRTDNKEELAAFLQISKHELKVQNAKDSRDKDEIKKGIKSIMFVQNIARQKYERLLGHSRDAENDSAEFYLDFDATDAPMFQKTEKLVSLPFDVIINNNIALHYFTQYLVNVDAEGYVFFYHNIEGFRTTVEMMRAEDQNHIDGEIPTTEKLRNLALQLYESYLGANAVSKINLGENLLRKFVSRLKTETITETFFDEIQEKVYDILENEYYLNGFKDSKMYVKLLAELDLLHDMSPNSDLDSLSSSKSEEEEKFNCDTVVPTDEEMLNELLTAEIQTDFDFPDMSSGPVSDENKEVGILFAEVHSTGITHHAGRTFAVYAISVSHFRADGSEEKWFIVRRYSEFYDFHEAITSKFPLLASFNFPSKKPFNNLTRQLMEKRRHMLNEFIQFILSSEILAVCDGLKIMVYNFLQPNVTEKAKKSFIRSVGTFVNPIKSSVKTVGHFARLVPDTFFELKVGFFKTFFKNHEVDSINEIKPVIFKENRADDIPFRIMLLLMDEVFNLRNKDLWFRRRIMALLRQIIKTMQGGAINRKIKDYVQGMTSATQIAEWLKLISKSIWPDGKLAATAPDRDFNTKMRTRMLAKMLLFSAIPDELKHIIGYETSYKGAMLIFNLFQYPSLNRRLLLVLFESFLKNLFPNNKFPELFKKLHSESTRLVSAQNISMEKIDNDQLTSQETPKTPEIVSHLPEIEKISSKTNAPEIKDKLKTKVRKEPKSNFFLECLPQSNMPSPVSKKRKKSVESAIFYTDFGKEEDSVILPLRR